MRKKLKIFSAFLILIFLVENARAQKVGNGGNFNNYEVRLIIDKIVLVLKNNLLQELSPIDENTIYELENTKEVFDLNEVAYKELSPYILITKKSKANILKDVVCIVGSTKNLAAILNIKETGTLIRNISPRLIKLESLDSSIRQSIVDELKLAKTYNLIDQNCIIE